MAKKCTAVCIDKKLIELFGPHSVILGKKFEGPYCFCINCEAMISSKPCVKVLRVDYENHHPYFDNIIGKSVCNRCYEIVNHEINVREVDPRDAATGRMAKRCSSKGSVREEARKSDARARQLQSSSSSYGSNQSARDLQKAHDEKARKAALAAQVNADAKLAQNLADEELARDLADADKELTRRTQSARHIQKAYDEKSRKAALAKQLAKDAAFARTFADAEIAQNLADAELAQQLHKELNGV